MSADSRRYQPAVGIDLGTTYSLVAAIADDKPSMVVNSEGSILTPSVVAFPPEGGVLVGDLAREYAFSNPDRAVASVKRQMGTAWTLTVDGCSYGPEAVSARILQKLKRDTEACLGVAVSSAVITVPAYFDDARRQSTYEAGRIAGLEVLRIVNEPTAAALAYGLGESANEKVLVFDLGGGTLDVSILDIADGVFEVRSTCGDVHLGGDDWDARIAGWLNEKIAFAPGGSLVDIDLTSAQIAESAVRAKIELTSNDETNVRIPTGLRSADRGAETGIVLTRQEFEGMTRDLLDRCCAPFERAMSDAGLRPGDLTDVVLVGGATRMPAVRRLVTVLAGREPRADIDPERVVAVGAATQASIMLGHRRGLLLVDVTPLSLGVVTRGGVMTSLIARNTAIPCKASQVFTTSADEQTSLEIQVLQGERTMARDNTVLGTFELTGLPPMMRGQARVEVAFAVDANGMVRVSAQDEFTGIERTVTVSGPGVLSAEEIEEALREAETHAEADRSIGEQTRRRNEAELAMYHAEQLLIDHLGALGDLVEPLSDAVSDVDIALETGDAERIKEAHAALLALLREAAGGANDVRPL